MQITTDAACPDESIVRDGGNFLVATFVDDKQLTTKSMFQLEVLEIRVSQKKRVSSCESEIIVNAASSSFKTKLTEVKSKFFGTTGKRRKGHIG
jgi:hypothetical protein